MQLAIAIDVNFAIVNKVDLFKVSTLTKECSNVWYLQAGNLVFLYLATQNNMFVNTQGKLCLLYT